MHHCIDPLHWAPPGGSRGPWGGVLSGEPSEPRDAGRLSCTAVHIFGGVAVLHFAFHQRQPPNYCLVRSWHVIKQAAPPIRPTQCRVPACRVRHHIPTWVILVLVILVLVVLVCTGAGAAALPSSAPAWHTAGCACGGALGFQTFLQPVPVPAPCYSATPFCLKYCLVLA